MTNETTNDSTSESQQDAGTTMGEIRALPRPVFQADYIYFRRFNAASASYIRDVEVRGHFENLGRDSEIAFSLEYDERRELEKLLDAAADRYIASLAAHLLSDPEGE